MTIAENITVVRERMALAARRCGRDPAEVALVAVSKTHAAEMVRQAWEAGVTMVGENYIQEARDKIAALSDCAISWHFIGHLQSNKAKSAVDLFDLIHGVDSLKLAREIDKQAAKIGKTQPILIQVNISGEATKAGTTEEAALSLVREAGRLEHLHVRGLMTMPPFFDQPERARPYFAALRRLRDRIRAEAIAGVDVVELSMGMTGDFEVAVEEGATLVRIGTAIFGPREYKTD
ncbi:MAG: YggS family pyridoxal phosphate-dependent enzyme [Desulfobacterales bacterium]|jgi:pyridoxal phosphate enzyme (YggS family)|nr:YggS family pyridoxal phosphate-dependent enzyme [Desulfobacteraceae bacterium]MDY0313397.1 YggS family pyridoxal phosphate-dependent enzyme [Desulfobacterales bacterium]